MGMGVSLMPFDSETSGKADPISLASQNRSNVNGANLAELKKGDVRKLRIGITPGRGRNVLPILLSEFRRRYYLLSQCHSFIHEGN